jgi:hypothetical protein
VLLRKWMISHRNIYHTCGGNHCVQSERWIILEIQPKKMRQKFNDTHIDTHSYSSTNLAQRSITSSMTSHTRSFHGPLPTGVQVNISLCTAPPRIRGFHAKMHYVRRPEDRKEGKLTVCALRSTRPSRGGLCRTHRSRYRR